MIVVPNEQKVPEWGAGSPAPKPHDPRSTQTTPEDLTRRFEEALAAAPADSREELAQYEAAYAVLADVLQDQP